MRRHIEMWVKEWPTFHHKPPQEENSMALSPQVNYTD
jgi:hypothetical protein